VKVAVTGASGLIGSRLLPHLRSNGHEVLCLVRRPPRGVDEVEWNPTAGTATPGALEGVDAVIHLAGAGVGDKRWSDAYKREILGSRVDGTTTIATLMAGLDRKPQVLISSSASGIYGDTGDTAVDETAAPGSGFLADVCVQWEAAANPAREAGIRVVHPRTGLVMSRHGGALAKLLPIFKAGAGGRLGSGKQWWSHISMRDEVAALTWLLTAELEGPVNLTAPEPARNSEVTSTLAGLVKRKAFFPVPAAAMKIALGEFSADVLGSQRVLPHALVNAGFTFSDPTIAQSLAAALQD
jgi:uncharacterized protein (TIGR01777 family)